MSLANDLLNTLSASQVDENDDTLVIDHYTRQIAIPKRITNLGVENDDDTLRLNFRMPRYIGKIDLSKFRIRVNYMNARGDSDAYDVVDAAVVGSNITFSWEVGPVAVAYKGNTVFNVCVVLLNSDGNVDREYNTTIATLPVLEGLEVDEQSAYAYSDLIEQWRQQLFGIGDTEEAAIKAVSQTEQQNIVNKGAEVLATIPADYTTAVSMTDNADRTKADAIVCEAEGELITVDDSSDDYVRGLRVFGKTTQVKTSGAQLAQVNINVAGYAYYGVTSTATKDGNILIDGTATDRLWNRHVSAELTAGETYTLSSNSTIALAVWDATMNAEYVLKNAGSESITFVAQNTGTYAIVLCNETGSTFSSVRANIMLNKGESAFPWEPYTGGIYAPNPEHPQELVSIESPTVNICGKNLADFTCFSGSNNYIALVNVSDLRSVKKGKQYNLSVYLHATAPTRAYWNNAARLYAYLEFDVAAGTNRYTYSFTALEDGDLYETVSNVVNKYPTSDDVVVTALNAQLEFGDKATDYESYNDQTLVLDNHVLPGLPVDSDGNYTDSNGQQWICDEIDFERGVYVKRIHTVVFDGSENITREQRSSGTYRFVLRPANNIRTLTINHGLCTHFEYSTAPVSENTVNKTMAIWTTGNAYCRYDSITSADEMASWLNEQYMAGDPVKLIYILETPIESPLTQAEINAFQFLHTNCPNTTVMNNVGAYMALKYNSDTKTYLNKYIRPETWIFTLEDGSTVTKVVHSA